MHRIGRIGVIGRTSKELDGTMRTLALALAYTRKMIGRRAVHAMLVDFNRSAIHAD